MRVLVTGATGFIGFHVVRRFIAGGAEVFALARPPLARVAIPGVAPLAGDLTDPSTLETLAGMPPFDVVCHLAADTRMDAPPEAMEANVQGTAHLLAALRPRLAGRRFLFASSIAAVDRTRRPRGPLTEADPPAPRSPYGLSKLRCEELIAAEARAQGFAATCLRLGTIYGPGQERGGLVTLDRAARSGSPAARIPWPGRISFGHVADVAEVFWRLAERKEPLSGTFFVAETRPVAMGEAARILRQIHGDDRAAMRGVGWLLRLADFLLWLPGLRRRAPWSLRAALADTIACDSGPITRALDLEWTPLEEGLRATFGERPLGTSIPPLPGDRPVRSLVSGVTGFLGSALARALAARHGPENVIGLVREPLPEAEEAAAGRLRAAGIRLVPCDLLARPAFEAEGLSFDVLYHLAAETDSGAPPDRLRVNTEGTRNLLETLGGALRGRRIVLAGATAAVDRARRPRTLLAEEDPPSPRTAYGASKLEAERIAALLAERFGAALVVPRFSPIYTADLSTGFLKAFCEQVRGRSLLRRVAWPGRITVIRREDAVAILRHLGETGAGDGEAVHIGDGEVYRYADLLRDLRRRAGDEGRFLPIPLPVWAFVRGLAWLPVLRRFVPWRLSCLLGDDLAVSTEKLRRLYPGVLKTWADSVAEIQEAAFDE